MICLIFHKDDELSLIKYQKEFIKHNNNSPFIFYGVNPLHLIISNENVSTTEQLKSFADEITSIQTKLPLWDNESHELYVNIEFKKNEISETFRLVLVKTTKQRGQTPPFSNTRGLSPLFHQKNKPEIVIPTISGFNFFSKKIKIFRIANKTLISENCSAISDSVWKKLHN